MIKNWKDHHAKPHTILLGVVLITMFFFWKVNNIAIVGLFVYSAFIYYKEPFPFSKKDLLLFLPTFLFLCYLLGALRAADPGEAWAQLEKRLPLLGFPLIFFFLKKRFGARDTKVLSQLFLLVCMTISIICYAAAIWNIIRNNSWTVVGTHEREYFYFSYLYFTRTVGIDPIYLSFYINFCIAVLLVEKRKSVSSVLMLSNFLLFNLLVASKIGILCLGLMLLLYIFFHFQNKLSAVLLVLSTVSAMALMIINSHFLRTRFIQSTEIDYDTPYAGEWNSFNQRLAIWNCGLDAIKGSMPWGYGTSNGQLALNQAYREKGYIRGYEDEYNVHNEYMHTVLDIGIPGLIVLLMMILVPMFESLKHGIPILFYFQLLTALYFLVEVVFARRHGIFFYSFFYCIIIQMLPAFSSNESRPRNAV